MTYENTTGMRTQCAILYFDVNARALHTVIRKYRRLSSSVKRKRAEFVTAGDWKYSQNTTPPSLSLYQHADIMLYVMCARGSGSLLWFLDFLRLMHAR